MTIVGICGRTATTHTGWPRALSSTASRRGPFTTTGPLVVDRADLVDRVGGRELDLEWRAIPDVNSLRVGDWNALREDLETLNARLRDDRLPGRALAAESELPGSSPRSTGGRSSAAAASRC